MRIFATRNLVVAGKAPSVYYVQLVDLGSCGLESIGCAWTLVEANDKKFAPIKVFKTICKRIERALDTL